MIDADPPRVAHRELGPERARDSRQREDHPELVPDGRCTANPWIDEAGELRHRTEHAADHGDPEEHSGGPGGGERRSGEADEAGGAGAAIVQNGAQAEGEGEKDAVSDESGDGHGLTS